MVSGKPVASPSFSRVSPQVVVDASISGLLEKHQQELENLTLTAQPVKTLKLFILATVEYLKQSTLYLFGKGGWLLLLSSLVAALGILLMTIDGPHEKHVQEILRYFQFGFWWVALGVASSIGLGSGLHTFVLYLGPHIALFTIKTMQCGRIDLKSAPYDTIQFERGPSWLVKDCSEYGSPVFPSLNGLRVPLSSILPQVQLEAILWGIGTALGELPPYFISSAARMSGSKCDAMEELDASPIEDNGVPNPLFDLAGIMCGQFGIPFWKFFIATMIGKAIIKTHIQAVILPPLLQTIFIISVCNNQLLNWIEKELIWVLSLIPGLSSILPNVIAKLHTVREKYLAAPPPVPSNIKIVTATAQNFLRMQHEKELVVAMSNESVSRHPSDQVSD
ncbi:hypothetical protein HHK36_022805 [Tetracentron sinense]|uniref:Vacuole membrane protein 1 n=1 Tax=Tetracentron sinense TaxID=13715 RepID=A0A835D6F4_TETSI|nr:hypothetical protein HHK36_022805 [Tetracentron sinense]